MELNPDLLGRRAAYQPQRPAAHFRERWWTYGELHERAERAARHLAALGLQPGDRVGVLAENHLAYVDLLVAAARTGTVLTPYNYRLGPAELAALIEETQPGVLFVGETLSAPPEISVPVYSIEELGQTTHTTLGTLRPASLEDTAMLCFTGGTTGRPKGAMLSHRQLVVNGINTVFGWQLEAGDACICATPMFHAAFHALSTPLLQLGGRVPIMERFDPGAYLELIAETSPTILFMVPTMFRMLEEHERFDATALESVRFAISGGAPCPDPVRERFAARGVRFRQGYGLTECGVNCFALDAEEAAAHPYSIGRPMPHLEAQLVDDEGAPVGDETEGELWLSGPVVMQGYFGRPDADAEAFAEVEGRRWLRTGDLAVRDSAGRFRIVGRRKDMFISGGENVYPAEIETVIYDDPAVSECAVVGVPDPKWGEVGLAAIVVHAGDELDIDSLRAKLKERLARYKVPKRFEIMDELPKSGAGKILKREIAKRFSE